MRCNRKAGLSAASSPAKPSAGRVRVAVSLAEDRTVHPDYPHAPFGSSVQGREEQAYFRSTGSAVAAVCTGPAGASRSIIRVA